MEIPIDVSSITDINEDEIRRLIEQGDDFWASIFSLIKARVFDGYRLSDIIFVFPPGSELQLKVFHELNIPCKELDRSAGILNFLRSADLVNLIKNWVYVYDPDNCLNLTPGKNRFNILVSNALPIKRNLFGHFIEVRLVDDTAIVKVDGKELKRIPINSRRFDADLSRIIAGVSQTNLSDFSRRTEVIVPDTSSGKTTLSAELLWARSLLDWRMMNYRLQTRDDSIEEKILRILLKHSDVQLHHSSRVSLLQQIRSSVNSHLPIPISLTIANGMRVPHSLKNKERFGPPTFAWMYNLMEFALINRKVMTVWPKGVVFYLMEEGFIFCDLLGVSKEIVYRNLNITQQLIDGIGAPAKIVLMLPEHFPAEKIAKVNIAQPTEEEIFSMLCSLEEMQDREIFDLLYTTRQKDFSFVRKKVGSTVWEKAREFTVIKNKMLQYRKDSNLFVHLIGSIGDNVDDKRLIDAAITEKEGRICFKLTGQTLFNHGASIVNRMPPGKVWCVVLPEYRLEQNYFGKNPVRPVFIAPDDFGYQGQPYIWFYELVQ